MWQAYKSISTTGSHQKSNHPLTADDNRTLLEAQLQRKSAYHTWQQMEVVKASTNLGWLVKLAKIGEPLIPLTIMCKMLESMLQLEVITRIDP